VSYLDRISLVGLRAYGYHGVLPAERAQGQEFVADAVLWFDTSPAAAAQCRKVTESREPRRSAGPAGCRWG